MRRITILLISVLLVPGALAQDRKLEEVKIKTSSQCGMCKERIEEALAFTKGVKKSELNLETQIVTVKYKKEKTSPEKIRKAISRAGYDADDVAADMKAYKKLPACCKKPDDPDAEPHQ
jgi:copper chaperone CopZ